MQTMLRGQEAQEQRLITNSVSPFMASGHTEYRIIIISASHILLKQRVFSLCYLSIPTKAYRTTRSLKYS